MTNPNAIQRTGPAALAPTGSTWTADDIALIRAMTADGTSDEEFKLFLYMANKYQLDPLVKQIWCVKNKNRTNQPAQMFAGRDGFLTIAHRSDAFDGMETLVRVEPVALRVEYTTWENGQRRAATFTRDSQYVATCTVWHKGMTHPITAEVWEEEYSTGQALWASKPRTMIAKVAECQALRKAFNISGLYDPDEIRDDRPAADPPTRPAGTKRLGAVDEQPGEIIGEHREIPNEPPPLDLPTGIVINPGRELLYARLRRAAAMLGIDSKAINEEVLAECGTPVKRMEYDDLERVVEKYERQAADVQGEAAE